MVQILQIKKLLVVEMSYHNADTIHHHLLLSVTTHNGVRSVSYNKVSYLMVFGQNTPVNLHRYLVVSINVDSPYCGNDK